MKRLVWFAFAGGTGFVVDAGVLQILLSVTSVGPFIGRVISIAVAMTATWLINRTFTFGKSDRHVAEEGARYGVIGVLGALLNYGIYSAIVLALPGVWPVMAVAVSSVAAMAFSYLGYSRFVFGKPAR